MATIYEVSVLAGVSLATVSRVLNNSELVSEKTRLKVQAAIDELGYRPSSAARSLASNRSDTVGVLVPVLHGPFFGTLLSGIETILRQAGKHAIITVGNGDLAGETAGIEFLGSRDCDAMILHVDAVSDDFLEALNEGSRPVVLVNRLVPGMAGNCISLDNELGGYLATRSLLAQGHRAIACISGPLGKHDAAERFAGYRRALSVHGLSARDELLYEGDFHESGGIEGMRALTARGVRFSAVICGNDEMAAGAMTVAQEQGLAIPRDLSVVGFDNVNFSRYLSPKLTTIDYPMDEMGQMAARLVLRHAYGRDDAEIRQLFEPRLLERASTGPPRAA